VKQQLPEIEDPSLSDEEIEMLETEALLSRHTVRLELVLAGFLIAAGDCERARWHVQEGRRLMGKAAKIDGRGADTGEAQ
jgi:hypothetical protein